MNEPQNPSTPPDFDQLLISLAEQTSSLAVIVRTLAEGVLRGDSPKKIESDLYMWWDHEQNMQSRDQKDAVTKELFLGQTEGELAKREYIRKQILDIYADIIHIFTTPSCTSCGRDLSGNEVCFCEGCDDTYCPSCFDTHFCMRD
jgi:hypothetical protein